METNKQVLLISENQEVLQDASQIFKDLSAIIPNVCRQADYKKAIEDLSTPAPALIVIDADGYKEDFFSYVKTTSEAFPQSRIVCAGNIDNVEYVLRLVKSGSQDFLKLPLNDTEVMQILKKAVQYYPTPQEVKAGHCISLLSPKGGTGVTFLTVNLAIMLAEVSKKKIAICDLRPQCGDVATYLNMNTPYTLRDMIDNIDRIDQSFLDGVTLKHSSGVHVFASPREDQEPLNTGCLSELQSILSFLKENYDYILVDGCYVDEAILQIELMHSDHILLLGNLDVPSLKGLVSALHKLGKHHFDSEKIGIVINRFNAKNRIDVKDFEKKAGHPVSSYLFNDYALCIESINTGKPLTEIGAHSNLAKKIKELAKQLHHMQKTTGGQKGYPVINRQTDTPAQAAKGGLFGWLL